MNKVKSEEITETTSLNEANIKDNKQFYRSILQTAMDGFWITDIHGNILEVNDTYCQMSGYSEQELLTMNIPQLDANENVDETIAHIEKLMKNGSDRFETHHRRKDSSIFDVEVSTQYQDIDGGRCVVFLRDITDRKQAVNSLKKAEEKFSKAFKVCPEALTIISIEDGTFIDVNDAFISATGFLRDEVIGHTTIELDLWIDMNERQRYLNEMLSNGFIKFMEFHFRMKNKEIRDYLVSGDSIELDGKKCSINFYIDITERKLAEQALRDNEHKYRTVIENIHEALIMEDVEGNLIYANNEFYEMFGYPKDQKGLLLKDYTSTNSYQQILDRHNRRMDGEPVEQEFQYEGVRSDGTLIWLEARVSPLYENGRIIGTLSLEQNITERKKAEELLKHNEEKYRTLFEANVDGISIFFANADNSISNFVEVNESAAKMLGYTREEFLQLSPLDLEEIDDEKIILERQMKLMQNGFINFETELKHKDGSISTVDMITNAIRFDNRFALMNIVRDITEKKKAEEFLSQHRAELKAIYDFSPVMMCVVNADRRIVFANPAFTELTGTPEDLLIGGHACGVFGCINALDDPRGCGFGNNCQNCKLKSAMEDTLKNATGHLNIEHTTTLVANGKAREVSLLGSTAYIERNNQPHLILCLHDISERKQAEQELMLAKDKAEQNDKLKTSFLQNISHEIRTPLNGIMGFSSLLKDSDDIDKEERNEYIDIITSSSNRLLGIINDVLEMSRLSSGLIKCHNSAIKIDEIIKYYGSVYASKIQSKDLKFIITATPDSKTLTILLDKDKLYQILSNLFNNAIKFTKQGEIEFAISIKNDNLVLSIRDTGIGIIEEYIDKIFDRFWQYEAFSRTSFGGTGLGLSISKEIANIIDVEIEVNSLYGSGSTFSIIIPGKYIMNNQDDKHADDTSANSTIDLSDKTILVVEDEVTNYIYLEKLLEKEKAEIFWVENGLDAVDIAKNMDFDLILMDIKLPIMDGIEATRLIKQFKPNMVIVAQTAYTTPEDREKALSAGCDDFISKPMRKEDLYKILKSALKQ